MQVWFLLVTPTPVSPWAPRHQTAWWPQTDFWCFSMRAKLGDNPETSWFYSWWIRLGLYWRWGNESCAVYRDPSRRASLFSSETRPGLCQNIPVRALSDVLDSRPAGGFKPLSRVKETDGSSICLDKRWETIGLTVKDRNPSRVSVTLFCSDVLELGQHWEKIVASCVVCRWPTLELF